MPCSSTRPDCTASPNCRINRAEGFRCVLGETTTPHCVRLSEGDVFIIINYTQDINIKRHGLKKKEKEIMNHRQASGKIGCAMQGLLVWPWSQRNAILIQVFWVRSRLIYCQYDGMTHGMMLGEPNRYKTFKKN